MTDSRGARHCPVHGYYDPRFTEFCPDCLIADAHALADFVLDDDDLGDGGDTEAEQ